MTVKSLVRFILGFGIVSFLFLLVAPPLGIPSAQLIPPPFVYGNATGKTQGVVTRAYTEMTRNIFKTGERIAFVDYQFQAPYAPLLFSSRPVGGGDQATYSGTVSVALNALSQFPEGSVVPIRYEKTYPVISGIDREDGGRSVAQGSGLFSGWLLWFGAAVVVGYFLADSLQRVILRENY